MIWGPNEPTGFEVFVPYHVDDLAVSLDGEPAAMTIEHAQGFTFAYGPAPSADATIEVIVERTTGLLSRRPMRPLDRKRRIVLRATTGEMRPI